VCGLPHQKPDPSPSGFLALRKSPDRSGAEHPSIINLTMSFPRNLTLPLALVAGWWCAGCGGGGGGAALTPAPKAKWTVLVYLNAANDLFSFSGPNVDQMERAAGNPQVRMIVQWKQSQRLFPQASFDGTRRYLVKPNGSSGVQSQVIQDLGSSVDMGSAQSLHDFVLWGKTYFPADRYVLVLWNHGNGWRRKLKKPDGRAFSYDDDTHNAIQIWQLPKALQDQKIDIIAWDCSLMQMSEVAYEVRANAKYVVGSEESPPAAGFPYDVALSKFRDTPDMSSSELAKSFVDAMNTEPGYQSSAIEESVIDTSKLTQLSTAVDTLASQLISNNSALSGLTKLIRQNAKSYKEQPAPPRYYFDIWDISNRYRIDAPQQSVRDAALAVRNAVDSAVLYERHNANSSGSHGISIDFSPSSAFLPAKNDYLGLSFGQANRWESWLSMAP
jgi:hypothetical protein